MAQIFLELDERLTDFIKAQKIFFVGTAPLYSDGLINVSPKGYNTFKVFDNNTVGYIDYPGSGNEAARNLSENGRLNIMFCSFEEKPLIVRLYGRGEIIERKSDRFYVLGKTFGERFGPWIRQIVILHISKIKTSCGESVPFFEYKGEREDIHRWAAAKEEKNELEDYILKHL